MKDVPLVISLEQGLSLPHGTQRMIRMGWRVIRIEMPHRDGVRRGDPNRFIGPEVGGKDRCAYFVPSNTGKQSLTIDLSTQRGQDLLVELIQRLDVDVFCVNTLPANHTKLGIDAARLQAAHPTLIWASLSAWGIAHPNRPGYDPAMQGELGFMSLTGEAEGIPLTSGVPMIDLLAGEQTFTAVCLALWQRDAALFRGETHVGVDPIDISMARCAVAWLPTKLPLPTMGVSKERLARHANRHPMFGPVNSYAATDGWVFLAIGSDDQWRRLVSIPWMSSLESQTRTTNEGRIVEQEAIDAEITSLTRTRSHKDILSDWQSAGLVATPINGVEVTSGLEGIAEYLLHTTSPDGSQIPLTPSAFDAPLTTSSSRVIEKDEGLPFPPKLGEQTEEILLQAGFSNSEISHFKSEEII